MHFRGQGGEKTRRKHNAVNAPELCYLMGMIMFWFQKHNHADQERNAPGRAYPELQLRWYSTVQKNRHYKEAARREELLQMRRQKKITAIIAIQMSSCFANKY